MKRASGAFLALLCLFIAFPTDAQTPARTAEAPECSFNGDCEDPLVCAGSYCRTQCMSDRDCSSGWECRQARITNPPTGDDGSPIALPSLGDGYNRCVPPGGENLVRIDGVGLTLLPVTGTRSGTATKKTVPPASASPARTGYGSGVYPFPNPPIKVGDFEFRHLGVMRHFEMRHRGGQWKQMSRGLFSRDPVAVLRPGGDVLVFGWGRDAAVWGSHCTKGECGEWHSLGGKFLGGPSVKLDANGNVRVTAKGMDARDWSNVLTGDRWSGWQRD